MTNQRAIEDELDAHIKDCGELMLQAHAENDYQAARDWLAEQQKAIASRTQEHQARLNADVLARVMGVAA